MKFYEDAVFEMLHRCNLCGGGLVSHYVGPDRYGLHVQQCRCPACGLLMLSPRMRADKYAEFYKDGHYRRLLEEFYPGRLFDPLHLEPEQKQYADRLVSFLLPHMDALRSGLLLDVGGSTGVVAEALALAFDLDATVIEPSQAEAERARSRGLSVANASVAEFAPKGTHYDLVTLCQTVDHLLDIKGDLQRIRQWTKPGGLFFVDFVENGPIKIDHPYYLTRETMRAYLEQTGFAVKVLEPSPDGLHVNVLAEVTA